ncbi:uncharacterized protein TRIADDRAFT_51408 [Trichoplax adhaerens]|uniref:Uncharacterized protein n=1 Tax=Trichoplax adhaerens TaxID=10228 RepID=B3RIX8_TRIAD|nr:predicted protein [Trichoplax adhaerens]EDV28470.1 predicted protein [Trichoplax adhaerens]|eukprot:XP_002107672.1 predicted protein [Trichoplax adhaerens]
MSHKICLHLSILAALAIICQARLIQRNDDFDIHERDELSPEKSAMKNLPWQNIRHDVDDDKEYMALKSKRDAYEKGQEILSNTDLTQPIHVNPLKDYLYRADDKSNQKILYPSYYANNILKPFIFSKRNYSKHSRLPSSVRITTENDKIFKVLRRRKILEIKIVVIEK